MIFVDLSNILPFIFLFVDTKLHLLTLFCMFLSIYVILFHCLRKIVILVYIFNMTITQKCLKINLKLFGKHISYPLLAVNHDHGAGGGRRRWAGRLLLLLLRRGTGGRGTAVGCSWGGGMVGAF